MPNTIDKGNFGEITAKNYLLNKGYEVLELNWRDKHLEIDIIAQHLKTLVIVEVKLRANNAFGNPEFFVDKAKQKHLIKAANAYIHQTNCDLETRFDIISITGNETNYNIVHIEEAFYPTLR